MIDHTSLTIHMFLNKTVQYSFNNKGKKIHRLWRIAIQIKENSAPKNFQHRFRLHPHR